MIVFRFEYVTKHLFNMLKVPVKAKSLVGTQNVCPFFGFIPTLFVNIMKKIAVRMAASVNIRSGTAKVVLRLMLCCSERCSVVQTYMHTRSEGVTEQYTKAAK